MYSHEYGTQVCMIIPRSTAKVQPFWNGKL